MNSQEADTGHALTAKNFLSVFPIALRGDKRISALAEITAEALEKRAAETGSLCIFPNVMSLPEDLLDILAYDFKVDWWDPNYALDEKRQVLRDNWYVHRRMGTKAAVETALRAVYRDAVVLEWFEYGGKPGYFRLWTDVTNEDFVPALRREILRRMDHYKRLSAHLEAASYYMRAEPARAWAYLAYGGQTQKRRGEIKAPPSVRPPEAKVTVIYGGVLAGMTGAAKRTVEIPHEVKPPDCKPSMAAGWIGHFAMRGNVRVEASLRGEPPRVKTKARYGGVLAGIAGALRVTGTGIGLGV